MKNISSICLIIICCIFISFTFGFFIGRNLNHTDVEISKIPETSESRPNDNTNTQPTDQRININTADENQLQMLPGIGETLARRIVEYRDANGPFTNVTQLMNVDGIGSGRLEAIIDYITVGG